MPNSPASDQPNQILRGILLRCAAVLSFALMSVALKWTSADHVNAAEMLFYRSAFGLPLVIAWMAMGPGFSAIYTQRPMAHLIRSTVGITNVVLVFSALILLPLADATAVGFSSPIFATVLSAVILSEKVTRARWIAVGIGFVGVIVVLRPGGDSLPMLGLVCAVAAAFGTGCVAIAVRQLGGTEQPATIVFWFFVCSCIVGGLAMPFFGQAHKPSTFALLALAGMLGATAQVLMTTSLRLAPVSVLMPFEYTQIIWTSLFGFLIWSYVPTLNTFIGAALISGGGLYIALQERRSKDKKISVIGE